MRAQCRAPVSCVFPVGPSVYPGWRLGFRQSSFSHIARVPSARRPYASARPLVSWHALVPFTFQIQVSHQTQEYPPNSSRLRREYDRAPRGAGWYLVWPWFLPDRPLGRGHGNPNHRAHNDPLANAWRSSSVRTCSAWPRLYGSGLRDRSADFERSWKLISFAVLAAPLAARRQSPPEWGLRRKSLRCRFAMSKPRTVLDSSGGELDRTSAGNRSLSRQSRRMLAVLRNSLADPFHANEILLVGWCRLP